MGEANDPITASDPGLVGDRRPYQDPCGQAERRADGRVHSGGVGGGGAGVGGGGVEGGECSPFLSYRWRLRD
jgi:hypothetical protein